VIIPNTATVYFYQTKTVPIHNNNPPRIRHIAFRSAIDFAIVRYLAHREVGVLIDVQPAKRIQVLESLVRNAKTVGERR
jgi:hypothetical protein